jgi:cyclopropane-fatty-acyl-phospholipid synthase
VTAGPGPKASNSEGAAGVIAALVQTRTGLDLPVRLRAWDGSQSGPADGPVLVARSPRALQRILWCPGELGLARAYVSGDLEVEGDLTDGLRRVWAAPRNEPRRLGLARAGLAAIRAAPRLGLLAPPPAPPRCELRVRGRLHSRSRDHAVIAGHYDLPAAFYQLILDSSMAYSCACWDGADQDLKAAQHGKLNLICRKLELRPGAMLLDMGCGWGSLTLHAARDRVRVTGVTLSVEQGRYVRQRARGLGLGEDRVEVRIQDYRDPLDSPAADGRFDAVASVEMGEHVGAARYPAFCRALYDQLRPGGRLLVQQMSRTSSRGGGSFIASYIAPDMDMRPVADTIRLIREAGFEIAGVEAMGEHYVRTIRAWLGNFERNLPAIGTLLSAEQVRVWRLYLAGSALAFEQGRMGVDQILAVKPEGRPR